MIAGIADAVENRLRLLAGGDEPFLAQLGEVLRHGRLAEADAVLQLPDRQLALRREVTEHQQPAFVGHRFKQTHSFFGLGAKLSQKLRIHATLHKTSLI